MDAESRIRAIAERCGWPDEVLQEVLTAMEAGHSDVVAWDVYERRVYGAQGEVSHRVLWVADYKRDDGTTPDLDWLLEKAGEGGIDPGARTIHVRSLVYGGMLDEC